MKSPKMQPSEKVMMIMITNCFCIMVERWKAFSLISSRDHSQRFSPSSISDMLRAGFEPVQGLNSDFFEWNCAAVITTTPQHPIPLLRTHIQELSRDYHLNLSQSNLIKLPNIFSAKVLIKMVLLGVFYTTPNLLHIRNNINK